MKLTAKELAVIGAASKEHSRLILNGLHVPMEEGKSPMPDWLKRIREPGEEAQ